eukprot:scaffold3255_cov191-Ochromonas_danica.AAC.13
MQTVSSAWKWSYSLRAASYCSAVSSLGGGMRSLGDPATAKDLPFQIVLVQSTAFCPPRVLQKDLNSGIEKIDSIKF